MKFPDVRSSCLSVFFIISTLFALAAVPDSEAAVRAPVGTETCVACHVSWQDNNPPLEDVVSANAQIDYHPVNFAPGHAVFYSIPEAYFGSIHSSTDEVVNCEGCHGSGAAHFGLGPMPNPIPQTSTCISCHSPEDVPFDSAAFLLTAHANPNKLPKITFDQKGSGQAQAKTKVPGVGQVALFKANDAPVTKSQRIEECSVCHNYALQYPQFKEKIANGSFKKLRAEVSCGACHDAHIPAPNGNQLTRVNSTVRVASLAGTTVNAVTPVEGRAVVYLNHKPYKINATGAQDDSSSGAWTRGSVIARPSRAIVNGAGTLSNGDGISDRLTLIGGGFSEKVRPSDTLFISGQASATAVLPAGAVDAGQQVTVEATLDGAGFEVERVIDDNTIAIKPRTDSGATSVLGTDRIGVVAKASVTYKKTDGKTATLNVFVPFTGSFNFEIRDMRTNTEDLCGSCHTQGKLKYTALGKKKDGSLVDLRTTHNLDIMGQYRKSGHADSQAQAFAEFNAGSSRQATYPFDMSITGSGGVDSLRNKGNTTFVLTTSNASNVYLSTAGNTTLPVLNNSYACYQCHNGLGSIDYQLDRQGTEDAQVLWGDTTVTCITCHDPHKEGVGKNIRVPVKLSYNSRFVDATKNPRGGINKFMDGTDIPADAGNSVICLFCHQGRESGLTIYMAIKGRGIDPYTAPDASITGQGFINSHYLAAGGVLWSRNGWEYFFDGVPQTYSSGNPSHQALNCTACHMGEAKKAEDGTWSEGGHTWIASLETCTSCHGPVSEVTEIAVSADYDGDGTAGTIGQEIDGLVDQVLAAFTAKGIGYDPNAYPYFYKIGGGTISWTTNTLSAAFNLNFLKKTNHGIYVHNTNYTVQILQDSLRALGVVPSGVRPAGNRPATDYRTIVVNP